MKQTLKFIGRGSTFNTKEGNTSAYIKDNGVMFLIDCGEDVFSRIIKNGILDDVNSIHVAITHLHSDHVGSLSSLIYYAYHKLNIRSVVYFPTTELKLYLTMSGNSSIEYDFRLGYNVEGLYIYNNQLIDMNFIFINSEHARNINSFSIITHYKGTYIFYSGDTRTCHHDMLNCLKHADNVEIYHDTSLLHYEDNPHTSLVELCDYIDEEHRHKVFCMHLDCDELIVEAKKEGFNVVELDK